MNLRLKRKEFKPTGIFGELRPEGDWFLLFTLEHAYPFQPDGNLGISHFIPKINAGVYTCERGLHKLSHMALPFETFEITGVEGHSGLLFHRGNLDNDSSGCVLLGLARDGDSLIHSADAFRQFMAAEAGFNSFTLLVT